MSANGNPAQVYPCPSYLRESGWMDNLISNFPGKNIIGVPVPMKANFSFCKSPPPYFFLNNFFQWSHPIDIRGKGSRSAKYYPLSATMSIR